MINSRAPQFSLPDQTGTIRTSQEFIGKKILLYFYPKDMTPGCTTETLGFQSLKADFKKENTVIIGISKDSVASHEKFCSKHDLDIILLSDTETEIIQAYGVWQEKINKKTSEANISDLDKANAGKKNMGISRESFLVNEDGILIKHWKKVKPVSHPQEVLDYL
jgi:peroxiredoxin Q/BCP